MIYRIVCASVIAASLTVSSAQAGQHPSHFGVGSEVKAELKSRVAAARLAICTAGSRALLQRIVCR